MKNLKAHIEEAVSHGRINSYKADIPKSMRLGDVVKWLEELGIPYNGNAGKAFVPNCAKTNNGRNFCVWIPEKGTISSTTFVMLIPPGSVLVYILRIEEEGKPTLKLNSLSDKDIKLFFNRIRETIEKYNNVTEAVSHGNARKSTYDSIDNIPKTSRLNDMHRWLADMDIPEDSGMSPQELHYYIKYQSNGTMELVLWIPLNDKDEIMYFFKYDSGALEWCRKREYNNHVGGNITELSGNSSFRRIESFFTDIAENIGKSRRLNEAVSHGKTNSYKAEDPLGRLVATKFQDMYDLLCLSSKAKELGKESAQELFDYIVWEKWDNIEKRFSRSQGIYIGSVKDHYICIAAGKYAYLLCYSENTKKFTDIIVYDLQADEYVVGFGWDWHWNENREKCERKLFDILDI